MLVLIIEISSGTLDRLCGGKITGSMTALFSTVGQTTELVDFGLVGASLFEVVGVRCFFAGNIGSGFFSAPKSIIISASVSTLCVSWIKLECKHNNLNVHSKDQHFIT